MKLMNGEKSVIGRRDRITIRSLSKKKTSCTFPLCNVSLHINIMVKISESACKNFIHIASAINCLTFFSPFTFASEL